jgi:chemotaxis protein MotB
MLRPRHARADLERIRRSQMLQEDWPSAVNPAARVADRAWLLIFTDLVSLMLTFFVLLFSMSNVKVGEWQNIIDSLSRTLRPTLEKEIKVQTATFNIGTIFRRKAIDLNYLSSVIEEGINDIELLADTQVMLLEDRLVIALPGDLLFRSGSAEIAERARDAMFVIGGMLSNIGNEIGVNGHTDPTPPSGDAYASNWELSTGRAAAVANALRAAGYEDNIIAFGYADSRFRQLPDIADAQRRALARRADIVVLPTAVGVAR